VGSAGQPRQDRGPAPRRPIAELLDERFGACVAYGAVQTTTAIQTPVLAPLSYSEEAAWQELRDNPRSFYLRGLTLTVPMPPGSGRSHAEQVVAELVARHDVFRTAYQTREGRVHRQVLPTFHHDIVEADKPVYGLPCKDPDNLMPSDLFRVWLIPDPEGGQKLAVDINEMLTDSWSAARAYGELSELVQAYAAGREPAPLMENVSYAEYARQQRDKALPAALTEYWREKLAGAQPPAYLPVTGPDPSGEPVGERVHVFADETNAALKKLCTEHRLSRFMAMVAVTQSVLAARSGQRDIMVCTNNATRTNKYTDVHGNFSNLVLLRTVLPADPSFAELAGLTRGTVLGALAHSEMPFLAIQRMHDGLAAPPVRVSYLPHRMHHYVYLDERPSGESWTEEAMFATWPLEVGFAEDKHARIAIWLNYDATRYAHAAMEQMIRDCDTVLRAAAADPAVPSSRLAQLLADPAAP
jgi:hypothetical protein